MFCYICGKPLPPDARFCPYCGREVFTPAPTDPKPAEEPTETHVKVFSFGHDTLWDKASIPVNEWLAPGNMQILSADFRVEATQIAGMIAPAIEALEVTWAPEPGGAPYQMAAMLDSLITLGTPRKEPTRLNRQLDVWQAQNPEREVAGLREFPLSLGLTGAWCTLFFYR